MNKTANKNVAKVSLIGKDVSDEIAFPLILARLMEQSRMVESGCREYTGYIHPTGYGMSIFKAKNWRTHRLMWMAVHGRRLIGRERIMHSCDNRRCIHPNHLILGTQKLNIIDAVQKGRQFHRAKTHCPQGHAYAEHAHFHMTKDPRQFSPWRTCKMCALIRCRKVAGWPEWAWTLPRQPKGTRPDFTSAKPVSNE